MRSVDWEISPTHRFLTAPSATLRTGLKITTEHLQQLVPFVSIQKDFSHSLRSVRNDHVTSIPTINIIHAKTIRYHLIAPLPNRLFNLMSFRTECNEREKSKKTLFIKKHFILSLPQSFWIDQSLHFPTLRTVSPTGKTAENYCTKCRFDLLWQVATFPKNQYQRPSGIVPLLCTFRSIQISRSTFSIDFER